MRCSRAALGSTPRSCNGQKRSPIASTGLGQSTTPVRPWALPFRTTPAAGAHVRVRSGDRQALATAALVQFRDIYTYFGKIPLRFAPGAPEPMSAFVMGRLRRRSIPRIATSVLTGRDLGSLPGIEVWKNVEHLEIEADPPVEAQADGEALGMVDGGTITWSPSALTVVVPPPDTD